MRPLDVTTEAASMKDAPTISRAITIPLPAWTTVRANLERAQGAQIPRLVISIPHSLKMTDLVPTVSVVATSNLRAITMRKPLPMTVRATSSHVTCPSSLNSITAGKKDDLVPTNRNVMQNTAQALS